MPGGELDTVPGPSTVTDNEAVAVVVVVEAVVVVGDAVVGGGGAWKLAVTAWCGATSRFTVQVSPLVGAQLPVQLRKAPPGSGVAVRVTIPKVE